MAIAMSEMEERLAMLENEVAHLKRKEAATPKSDKQGWKSIVGVFADDEYFEEAVRLGAEYRASQNSANK